MNISSARFEPFGRSDTTGSWHQWEPRCLWSCDAASAIAEAVLDESAGASDLTSEALLELLGLE